MNVELLGIGTELLLGQLVDTNTAYVASHLADVGVNIFACHAVGDNRERIAEAMSASLERADGVVTTGGLGPTVDDLTRESACDALGLVAVRDERLVAWLYERFATLGLEMRENNLKQADIPAGAFVLENPNGSAPGFVAFDARGKFVASMPGVPYEMKAMLTERLIPYLRERYDLRERITTRIVHTVGITESEIDHRIADLFASLENPKLAVLAHAYRCDVKIMAKAASTEAAEASIAPVQAEIERRLDGFIYGLDDETLPSAVHRMLQARGQTLSVAESCTGGRIAAELTSTPGSSKSFLGAIVAYDNAVKIAELDVPSGILSATGAVSAETACAMALGVRARLKTDIGFATTGIAGPDGGSAEKPVGLVWFGLAQADGSVRAERMDFPGDRGIVQTRATTFALGLLWKRLKRLEAE
ncbi:MAG: competence/damage-inducible protein A [Candidatus Eremiobacteraeota bacterium]|nr:competence/damage-inducible protein A [Candidatus Eremiobacteraeota bacterium]